MSEETLPRVMIVDDSRIVRATIIKRIRDRFDVREAADGEDGWEALLVDPSIQLVITDHTMPRLDGYGLIERIRHSKVARIRDLPVIMISGDEGEEARRLATSLGASDFITKGTGTAELLARLETLVHLGQTQGALEEARADAATDASTGLVQKGVLIRQAEQAASYFHRHGGHLGVLIIGLDRYEELLEKLGEPVMEVLAKRCATTLAGVVRKEDSLARWAPSQFAIVTPGIDPVHTHLFAERLRGALAGAAVDAHGQTLRLTVTVGLASRPEDDEQSGDQLLAIAEGRMRLAQGAGGDCVVGPVARSDTGHVLSAEEALGLIAAGRGVVVRSGARAFARRLLPLLRVIGEELRVAGAVAEIEHRVGSKDSEQDQIT